MQEEIHGELERIATALERLVDLLDNSLLTRHGTHVGLADLIDAINSVTEGR